MFNSHCEGWHLRDWSGQMLGNFQVRLGFVPTNSCLARGFRERGPDAQRRKRATRGHLPGAVVLQERLRPMASAFGGGERGVWLRRTVEDVRAVPDPDRAWGTEGQQMFPASRRK